jgi:hypothetical protein
VAAATATRCRRRALIAVSTAWSLGPPGIVKISTAARSHTLSAIVSSPSRSSRTDQPFLLVDHLALWAFHRFELGLG